MVTNENNIDESQVILVDIGNTKIKYTLLSDVENEPYSCEDSTVLFSFIDRVQNITHLYIASVRNQEQVDEISTMCGERKIIFVEKHTEKKAFGIKNSYDNEQKMGVDRWLAMVGAAEKAKNAFFMVSTAKSLNYLGICSGKCKCWRKWEENT